MIPKQNLVRRFMEGFGQPIPEKPTLPADHIINLRFKLIREESAELLASETKVDYLDAVCDLLYVVYGAALSAGFNAVQIDAAFHEVHRSNMSKLWTTKEKEANVDDTLQFSPRFDRWICTNEDGKIIKSPSYSKAELERFCQ